MKSKILPLLVLFIFGMDCRTKRESNLNVQTFVGVDLTGKEVSLKDEKTPRVAINVYSPTCIPCFKEIPSLNYLRNEMLHSKLGEFYMVVDPYSIIDGMDGKPFEDVYPEAMKLMKEEVKNRKIELPILIMKPPFKVTPGEGLITGTPETLLFKTTPLILYYNFIGSISEQESVEDLKNDLKVKFFKRIIGGI
jgi:thiol-disulfide isomerase/thioredoxin